MFLSSISAFIVSSLTHFKNDLAKYLTIQQKKVTLVALAIFSALASGIYLYHHYFRLRQVSHLILNIDVNRTIMADDPKAGFHLQDILAMILAENYQAKWNGQKISFLEYVSSLIPGSHNGPIKKRRQAILKDFVYLLQHSAFQEESFIDFKKLKENPDEDIEQIKQKINQVKSQVLADIKKLQQADERGFAQLKENIMRDYKRMEEKLSHQPYFIFPSYFRLIAWLREKKEVNFHIILRTFGDDGQKIVSETEKAFPEEKFTHKGKYRAGKWHLSLMDDSEPRVMEKVKEVYRHFKSQNYRHLALQDDWTEWSANQEDQDHGKRFLLKLNAKRTHTVFIDDNIEKESQSRKNIVTPLDVESGQPIPINSLIAKKIAVRTETMKAILDDEYLIKVVQESLRLNGKKIV